VAALDRLATGRIARTVRRVGEVGAGSTLKVANNLMFAAINAAAAEAIALVEAAGLDADTFVDTVLDSGAATVSPLFTEIGPKMAAREYAPTFRLELLAKDLGLADELGRQVGGRTPVSRTVLELLHAGLAAGLGPADTAALVEVYRAG
jgi:3-hydroxyisobutyrate dehydrogenase